jgi:hypothetical protein
MQTAIGYLRVSTREQGRSGLGLAAQRHEIEAFGAREGFSVKSWHSRYRGHQRAPATDCSWPISRRARSLGQSYRDAIYGSTATSVPEPGTGALFALALILGVLSLRIRARGGTMRG